MGGINDGNQGQARRGRRGNTGNQGRRGQPPVPHLPKRDTCSSNANTRTYHNSNLSNKKANQETVTVPPQQASNSITQAEDVLRRNISGLKRLDSSFARLIGTSSQVAAYAFHSPSKEWRKTDTAGCLFVYARSELPEYGLVIMNRMNMNNMMQLFCKETEVVFQVPFLLLKHEDGVTSTIQCLWFYEESECTKIGNLFREMGMPINESAIDDITPCIAGAITPPQSQPGHIMSEILPSSQFGSVSGQGLLNMLISCKTKTHVASSVNSFNGYDNSSDGPVLTTGIELRTKTTLPVMTVIELEKTFLEPPSTVPISTISGENQLRCLIPSTSRSGTQSDGSIEQHIVPSGNTSMTSLCAQSGHYQNPGHSSPGFISVENTRSSPIIDFFSKLQCAQPSTTTSFINSAMMCRMQTVEQLERDMQGAGGWNENLPPVGRKQKDTKGLEHDLRTRLGIGSVSLMTSVSACGVTSTTTEGRKMSIGGSMTSSAGGSEGVSPKSPFLTPMTPTSGSGSASGRSGRGLTAEDIIGKEVDEVDPETVREVFENCDGQSLLLIPVETPGQETKLMWAKNRSSSRPSDTPVNFSCTSTGNGIFGYESPVDDFSLSQIQSGMNDLKVSPLTKEQLLQAIAYLLQNDSDFVMKIHQAYLKSLTNSLSHQNL